MNFEDKQEKENKKRAEIQRRNARKQKRNMPIGE